jgi:hypothetical protein
LGTPWEDNEGLESVNHDGAAQTVGRTESVAHSSGGRQPARVGTSAGGRAALLSGRAALVSHDGAATTVGRTESAAHSPGGWQPTHAGTSAGGRAALTEEDLALNVEGML